MNALKRKVNGGSANRPRSRIAACTVGLAVVVVAAFVWFSRESVQKVKLPSGYTLVLREVIFAQETKSVVVGPWWNKLLIRIPAKWVPPWLMKQRYRARQSWVTIDRRYGFSIVEELLPPADSPPAGGPGSFQHEVIFDGEPYQAQSMSGWTGQYYVICEGDSYPRRAPSFRVQIFALESGVTGRCLGEFRIRNPHFSDLQQRP